VKYAWINQHQAEFPITDMCRVMGVSRSGFYDSLNRPPSERSNSSTAMIWKRPAGTRSLKP
jgi:putative transposase